METATEAPVSDSKKIRYRSCKIEDDIVMKAGIVVEAMSLDGERLNVNQFLSGILKEPVDRAFAKALARLDQLRGKGKPPKPDA